MDEEPIQIPPVSVRRHPHADWGSYPHMSPSDSEVWRLFLQAPPVVFERLDYDVALGGAKSQELEGPHELKPMWDMLLRKRVDVVGLVQGERWIMEVKPLANMASLGQILTYDWLARVERGWENKTRRCVIAGSVDVDLVEVFARYGVNVYVCRVLPPFGAVSVALAVDGQVKY